MPGDEPAVTPTLSRQELDELKAGVDLVALFQTHGVAVQKSGPGFKALYPFHEEKTPSLSVDPNIGDHAPWPPDGRNRWPPCGHKKTGPKAGVN